MKKTGLILAITIILTGAAAGLEVSFVDEEENLQGSEFDAIDPGDFYSDFPEEFDRPDEIGSYSFTDSSLVTPNLFLQYEAEEDLSGEEMEIYYSSLSGDLRRPVSTFPAVLEGSSGVAEIEISSFEALYPGKIFAETEGEFVEVEEGLFPGNYSLRPDVSFSEGKSFVEVEAAFDSSGGEIHAGRDLSQDLLLSVERGEDVVAEDDARLGGVAELDTVLEQGDTIYVNSIPVMDVREAAACQIINESDSYFLMNESFFNIDPEGPGGGEDSCIKIEDVENTVIDFGDNTLNGHGNFSNTEACGLRIEDSNNIEVSSPRIQEFSRGLCVENSSEVMVEGDSLQENRIGAYSNDSEASLTDLVMNNEFREFVGEQSSSSVLTDISFTSAEASVEGVDLEVDSVESPPSDPEDTESTGQYLEVEGEAGSLLENLSFNYEEEPDDIYLFNGGSTQLEASSDSESIFTENELTDFGVFGTFIRSEEEDDEDDEEDDDTGNGGGAGGAPPEDPPPEPGPPDPPPGPPTGVPGLDDEDIPEVELVLHDERVEVDQGRAFEAGFDVEVNGNVSAPNVDVEAFPERDGWDTSGDTLSEILPGETGSGSVLVDIFQGEMIGEYDVRLEASTVINDTEVSLDNESLAVDVVARDEVRDLYVLEAPHEINITEDTARRLSFDLANAGEFRLENVTVEGRDLDRCLPEIRGSWSFDKDVRETFNYTAISGESGEVCEGAFVFSSEEEDFLTLVPAEVQVVEKSIAAKLTNNILPIIVMIWTVITAHRIKRRYYDDE